MNHRKRNSIVKDNLHGSIIITEYEKRIVSTNFFNRLHNISQNSTAYLTYPGNRTKRFEHSLGTMHLCSKMYKTGIINTDEITLENYLDEIVMELKRVIEYSSEEGVIHPYIDEKDRYNYEELNKYLNLELPYNVLCLNAINNFQYKMLCFIILYQATRAAALLHDLGHPPFSHITEFALKDILVNFKGKCKGEKWDNYERIISSYVDKGIDIHEQIGVMYSKKILSSISIGDTLLNKCLRTIEIVTMNILEENNGKKYPILYGVHKLMADSIDADRLDYIIRDSVNSGLDIGRIDYERFISSIRLCKKDDKYRFLINIRFLSEIEDFFKKRLETYKKLVYHHRVIKTDRLLRDIIVGIAKEFFNESSKYSDIFDISRLWTEIDISKEKEKNGLSIINWDDAYLLNELKTVYTKIKELKGIDNEGRDMRILMSKMEEFITNNKNYISIIKSTQNYKDFEKILFKEIKHKSYLIYYNNNFNEKGFEKVINIYNDSIVFSEEDIKQFNDKIPNLNGSLEDILYINKKTKNGLSNGFSVYENILDKEKNQTIKIFHYDNKTSRIKSNLDNEIRDIQKVFIYAKFKDDYVPGKKENAEIIKQAVKAINKKLKFSSKKKAIFVAVDGPNGSGKSSIIEKVYKKLSKDYRVLITKEPTDSKLGNFSREISNTVTGNSLACIVASDRLEHSNYLKDIERNYDIIISDRYIYSLYILQGMDFVDKEYIRQINSDIMLPDFQILLSASPKTLEARINERPDRNRLEQRGMSKKEIEYMNNAKGFFEHHYKVPIFEIDSDNPLDENVNEMIELILKEIKK